MPTFEYNFPAIRGVQAGREYYVSMCPLRLIPRIFLFDEDELRPELRAQRILNKNRIPEIARYILANKKGYTFSALTASIDGKVQFEPLGEDESERKLGRLRIPMDARFVINDGQHRRAGIEAALRENPDVGDETISVVFFVDAGLKRCQQMFADLNRYAIRPTRSLSLLYDERDDFSQTAKALLRRVPVFTDLHRVGAEHDLQPLAQAFHPKRDLQRHALAAWPTSNWTRPKSRWTWRPTTGARWPGRSPIGSSPRTAR